MTSSPSFRIRPYEYGADADRAPLEALAKEVVRTGTQFVFETIEPVMDYWFSPGSRVFVADADGEVIGTYAVKPNQPGRGDHVANAGYMVAEAARGRGVGHALGEHSLETARELGFRSMQFNFVTSCNPSAVDLWKRLGFEIVGTLPGAFRLADGELVDAYVMARAL
jgi:GNAT superfamily N-acetyltransferase